MTRALPILVALVAGCGPSLVFYDVVRTPTRECEIFPDDEFCDELSPPVVETWSVEIKDERTYVYADGDVWIAEGDGTDEDAPPRAVLKRSVVADARACTTTTERRLSFAEDGETFTGTLDVVVRLEGPPACGDTPRGETHAYALNGVVTPTP